MKATAKYLFDEDFASGRKADHHRGRGRAPARRRRSGRRYRKGFAAGAGARRETEAAQRTAAALGADRRRHRAPASRACRHRDAAGNRGGGSRGRGRREARAGTDRARALRRGVRARHRMLPPSGEDAACGRAHRRRYLRQRQGQARGDRRARAASRAAWWCCRKTAWRPATAASNGPTAASPATAPRRLRPSTTWSAAIVARAESITEDFWRPTR